MSSETTFKEYIITLHQFDDLESFYTDMETEGGNLYIPNRAVDCHLRRPVSRNTHYLLTDQEATQLRQDPRVLAVEIPPEQLGIEIQPVWTQTSSLWSKSDVLSQGQLNWGLLRMTEGSPRANWYRDGTTPDVSGTVTVPFSGKNVDVVIMDGRLEINHPEFAVNSDGTGGSRVVQYNWYELNPTVTGGAADTYSYTPIDTSDDWHGTFVAGISVGNTHGWARDANIYNISPSYVTGGISATYLFDYVKVWHQNKVTNPATGRKNPTVMNCSFAYQATVAISELASLVYRGTTYTAPFTEAQLTSFGLLVSGTDVLIQFRYAALEADITDCINAGVVVVGAAGNSYTKMDTSGGVDYDNTITYNFLYGGLNYPQTISSHKGCTPGSADKVICVGAVNARYNAAGEEKASYSNCGPRVDVFAPGSNIRSSSNVYQGNSEVTDARNTSYYVGRSNGTSFSSPQVTGLLATMMEVVTYGPTTALNYIINNAKTGQLYSSNNLDYYDLQGAPNRFLFAKYPTTKSITPDTTSVTPGQTVVYTINFSDVANGSLVYATESGTSTSTDFVDGLTQKTLTITNGTASWSRTVRSAVTGTRTSTLQLRTGGYDGNIQATSNSVTVTDGVVQPITYVSLDRETSYATGSTTLFEGQYTATFTLTTTNAPNGTVVYWTTLGNPTYGTMTNDDFTDGLLQGTVTIQDNRAIITRSARADSLTEGTELFYLEIHETDYTSAVKITSGPVAIADTSITPTPPPPPSATFSVVPSSSSVNEGASLTFTITTTNVDDGTQLYWNVSNSGDFITNSGTVTINSLVGTFSASPSSDFTTEGAETFTATIKTVSFDGTVVATSDPVTINDTSTTPVGNLFAVKITPTQYNSIRSLILGTLGPSTTGTPFAVQGYGQTLLSSPVSQYSKVTEEQLDLLRQDIVKAHTHQNGSAPTITDVSQADKIYASLFTAYSNLALVIGTVDTPTGSVPYTYPVKVAANQMATVTYASQTETYAAYVDPVAGGGWKNYAYYEAQITFTSADEARYFFNSGGRYNFTASHTGGTQSPDLGKSQNKSWDDLLAAVATDAPTFNKTYFYRLTDSYNTSDPVYIRNSADTTYAANYYRITAKSDVADNYQGGATTITFKIEFVDAFNQGNTTNYDAVDGTFTSTISRTMPKGPGAGGAIYVAAPTAPVFTPSSGFSENGTPIYITASYSITNPGPTTVTEQSVQSTFNFAAKNYYTGSNIEWTITATTTTGLNDFVETGWTAGTNINGYKTLTKTTTNSGSYANSTSSVTITTNPDKVTEPGPTTPGGPIPTAVAESFTITAKGASNGSGGGFLSNVLTLNVTDSSKTDTPGITVANADGAVLGPATANTCVAGNGLGSTSTWTITSGALTGTADLIIYGFYIDRSGASGIDNYKITAPSGWTTNGYITKADEVSGKYTLPTPKTITNGSSVNLSIQLTSDAGPYPSSTSVNLKVISNAGAVSGSGAATGPTYNVNTTEVTVAIQTPTVILNWSANPATVNLTFIGGSGIPGTGSTTLTVTNSGNSPATLSSFYVGTTGTIPAPTYGSFPTSISASGVSGNQRSISVTYSYYGSNSVLGQSSTVWVYSTHPLIGYAQSNPFTLPVNATKAFPTLSLGLSSTSISSEIYTYTSDLTITFYNTGTAPLTLSSGTFAFSGGAYNVLNRTGSNINGQVIQPNSSFSTTYQFYRTRIGAPTCTITVPSDDPNQPSGGRTIQFTLTSVQRVPTFKLISGAYGTTTTSWTDKAGRLAKDSTVRTEIANMEPSANYMFTMWWTEGQDYYTSGGVGVWATHSDVTDPKTLSVTSATSDASGFGTPWDGTGGAQETKYWRAGRNRFYAQIPIGKRDDGTQIWYTNSTSGTSGAGASSSWAVSTTSPEAACGTNQIWIGFKVVPVVTWSLSDYNPVQGSGVTLTVSGCASDSYIYLNTTLFQNAVGNPAGPNQSVLNGSYMITGSTGGFEATLSVTNAVGTYSTARVLSYSGSGAFYDGVFIGEIRSVDILSPQLNNVLEIDPGLGVGTYAVSLYPSAAETPTGTFRIYRRFGPINNSTYPVRVQAIADDSVTIYHNGTSLGTANGWTTATTLDVNITVVDNYTHWIFDFTNGVGPGYFAVAVYYTTTTPYDTLYFATESGICQSPSKW